METDTNINDQRSWKPKSTRLTSINIDAKLHSLARTNNIPLREATEFGIRFLLAQRDPYSYEYPNNLLSEKITGIVKRLNAKAQECEALRDQLNVNKQEDLDKEVDEIFKRGLNGE